jgi:hypothetical protein
MDPKNPLAQKCVIPALRQTQDKLTCGQAGIQLLSFPEYRTMLPQTPSLNPSPAGRGKASPSPSGGWVGTGEIPAFAG